MLHLQPITDAPTSVTEQLAARIADITIASLVAPHPNDRERLTQLLMQFAREIKRSAIEGD